LEVIHRVSTVVGYTTYIDLIRDMLSEDQKIISTGMTKEMQRVNAAIDVAVAGRSCAIVSSGDPGIYAMAGLVLEICESRSISVRPSHGQNAYSEHTSPLELEVVPGIPALCSGASLLGAPLMHDFAAISLSDLLTPWQTIENRLSAAAQADFVIAIYNPASRRRRENLARAKEIILEYRDGETPVGIIKSAMREKQDVRIVSLKDLDCRQVDMLTTLFIGNSTTRTYLDFMVTPRGYSDKYTLENGG